VCTLPPGEGRGIVQYGNAVVTRFTIMVDHAETEVELRGWGQRGDTSRRWCLRAEHLEIYQVRIEKQKVGWDRKEVCHGTSHHRSNGVSIAKGVWRVLLERLKFVEEFASDIWDLFLGPKDYNQCSTWDNCTCEFQTQKMIILSCEARIRPCWHQNKTWLKYVFRNILGVSCTAPQEILIDPWLSD